MNELGSEASRVREANALPLGWDIPNDRQIANIISILAKIADCRRRRPNQLTIESAILVMLILQTGRSAAELIALQKHCRDGPNPMIAAAGLYSCPNGDYIAVTAQEAKPIKGCNFRSPYIILPQSPLLQRLMSMLAIQEQQTTDIFKSDLAQIIKRARKICGGGSKWKTQTTKATRGFNAIRRWFRYCFRQASKDDPAFLSILAPSRLGPERILSTYVSIEAAKFWTVYYKSFSGVFKRLDRKSPDWLAGVFYGSGSCPDSAMLPGAIASLKRQIKRPLFDARLKESQQAENGFGPLAITSKRHFAMMLYTYVFATFGTGQRSTGYICDISQIDSETGFAWVKEKQNLKINMGGERGVFHAPAVRRQLQFYENYLDTLSKHLQRVNQNLARELRALRSQTGLTFFDIVNEKIVEIRPFDLCKKGENLFGWLYSKNTGRHWLRSKLAGEVPGDALAAQFGHHASGFDAWSTYSGLQPLLVMKALGLSISRLLNEIGLEPLGNTQKTHNSNHRIKLDFETFPANRRARAGQILASAIWNGAMLNRSREYDLLQELEEVGIVDFYNGWVDLESYKTGGAERWRIDEMTFNLLQRCEEAKTKVIGDPDKLLKEFLGSKQSVTDFRKAAEQKWRVRLPPILNAKAQGSLDNRSLASDRFYENRIRRLTSKTRYIRPYGAEVREDAKKLEKFIADLWDKSKWSCNDPSDLIHHKLTWKRKKWVYKKARDTLSQQAFYKQMSTLEQSITDGLIMQLQLDRGKLNPRGYSVRTITDRIERIWLDFVPLGAREDWESIQIERMPPDDIREKIKRPERQQKNVIDDIITVLKAKPDWVKYKKNINDLNCLTENRTVETLRHDEYQKLQAFVKDQPNSENNQVVYALCYRAGIRFSELEAIKSINVDHLSDGTVYLILNHNPYRRLKTFHSRRKIPLDLFLDDNELKKFKNLLGTINSEIDEERNKRRNKEIEKKNYKRFYKPIVSTYYKSDSNIFDDWLKRSTEWKYMSIYPLRHSFASNTLLALLWPKNAQPASHHLVDPLFMERRVKIKDRLLGQHSLGAIGPYAVAGVMGHTNPARSLFSYTHNLELALAEHVVLAN